MTSFQEFLHKKAEEQGQASRRVLREEWVEAVHRLIGQINHWLDEADPEGLLDRFDIQLDKAEATLGRYQVPGLKIAVGDLSVQVVPVAGKVVGLSRLQGDNARLAGRVDITDGLRRRMLLRIVKDGIETWEVWDEQFGATPLDRAVLESIIQELLA